MAFFLKAKPQLRGDHGSSCVSISNQHSGFAENPLFNSEAYQAPDALKQIGSNLTSSSWTLRICLGFFHSTSISGCNVGILAALQTHTHTEWIFATEVRRVSVHSAWLRSGSPRRCGDTGSSPVCLWPPSNLPCRCRCSRPSNRPSSSRTTAAGSPRCPALLSHNQIITLFKNDSEVGKYFNNSCGK